MSTSNIQNRWQCYGPHRPTPEQLIELLKFLPKHVEIHAVAIRGQGGGIVFEAYYEGAEIVYAFEEEDGELVPSTIERMETKQERGKV